MITYTLQEVSRRAQVTAGTLRQWESRYRWPRPARIGPGKVRVYNEVQMQDICRIAQLARDSKKTVGTYIIDGEPVFPTTKVEPQKPHLDFSSVPMPTTSFGVAVREDLERCLQTGHFGGVAACVASLERIHPKDRNLAVHDVLRCAREAGLPV